MESLQFFVKERKLELFRKPRPKITTPHDVLVKVFFAGITKNDLKMITGETPVTLDKESIIIGHEVSGIVREVGEAVTSVKKGDKVVGRPIRGCGACMHCQNSKPLFCRSKNKIVLGLNQDGGLAEYVLLCDDQVLKLPPKISLEQAILANTMSIISHCWDQLAPIRVGEKILLIGIGIRGGVWACFLHLQGHRKVTILETNRCRIEHLEKQNTGFECISPDELKKRHAEDPEYLFDVIIDCTRTTDSIESAFHLLDIRGKLLISTDVPASNVSFDAQLICEKEIKIVGSTADPLSFFKGLEYLEALSDRYLSYSCLGISTYTLRDYKEVIEHMKKNVIVKAVFGMAIRCTCAKKEEGDIKE